MSVLILDMKFPKTCAECEWSRYSFQNAWCGRTHKTADIEIAKNGRPDWCPLVPVPPHGDLIDRDALCGRLEKAGKIKPYLESGLNVAISFALTAPAIIEAEEGE